MITPQNKRLVQDGDAKAAEGKFMNAVALYESALDGTAQSADVHYRLALLYDDKMNDPLNALHHFKRYLALAPDGTHAIDAKNFMKRDELALLTNLSGDTVMSREESARLRNENLSLRKQLEEERTKGRNVTFDNKKAYREETGKAAPTTRKPGPGGKTYVVKPGDTLASISRKFYKSSARWKEIRNANAGKIDDPQNLKIGETLTIP